MSSERGPRYDLRIVKGYTFVRTFRPGALPYLYMPITGITQAAPARVHCVAHGIPDGWPVAIVSAKGMRQINAESNPPRGDDWKQASVADTDHIDLNAVNSANFSEYTSGGFVQLYTPTDLAGATASLTVWDKPDGTQLLQLTSPSGGMVLDNTTKAITATLSATAAAALTWLRGVYEAKLTLAGGVVIPLSHGVAVVETEA